MFNVSYMDTKVCYTALAPSIDQRVATEKLGFDPLGEETILLVEDEAKNC